MSEGKRSWKEGGENGDDIPGKDLDQSGSTSTLKLFFYQIGFFIPLIQFCDMVRGFGEKGGW